MWHIGIDFAGNHIRARIKEMGSLPGWQLGRIVMKQGALHPRVLNQVLYRFEF